MLANRVRMGSRKKYNDIDEVYLATDDDFWGDANGSFTYGNWDKSRLVIPHVIKGVQVTSYAGMFSMTVVEEVRSNNPNITDMSHMFEMSFGTTLDLSSFDTSNVTDMSSMFQESQATTLDLSSFNTSNVTSMNGMFINSQATTLDLSSFDTSNVTDMGYMFEGSRATTGYARTQADADRFNNSYGKPSELVFVVK